MKIKYVHFSEPEKEKVFDTQNSYRDHLNFVRLFFPGENPKTPKEWDAFELSKLERDLKRGHILSYQIVN